MKYLLARFGTILISLGFLFLLHGPIPVGANSSDFVIPASINGLPVIYVETVENTVGLSSGQAILVLLDNSGVSLKDSLTTEKLLDYISANPLPQGVSLEVYGGSKASIEEFNKIHEENNKWMKQHGPFVVSLPSSKQIEPKQSMTPAFNPSYAIFRCNDANLVTTVQAITANWYAPSVGGDQGGYSAFLTNGMTDTGYFIQSGQIYAVGSGINVWASDSTERTGVPLNVGYTPSHEYECSVVYSGGGLGWQLGCQDWTGDLWDCHYENRSTGTKLKDDNGTSVFLENFNTNSTWYNGFTNPITAFGAEVYKNGNWTSWASGQIVITNLYGPTWPNNGIITGSLLGYQQAQWHLQLMPLGQ